MQGTDVVVDGLLVAEFRLGEAVFGVDAKLVQEVVKVGAVTRVSGAPVGVVGIRNLRGRIVTVVDTATHLGLGAVAPHDDNRLLIVDHQGECFGFLVDAVREAVTLDPEQLLPPPASLDPALRGRLRGVWVADSTRLMAVVDTVSLLQWSDAAS